jgi:uncharacterized membrane protein
MVTIVALVVAVIVVVAIVVLVLHRRHHNRKKNKNSNNTEELNSRVLYDNSNGGEEGYVDNGYENGLEGSSAAAHHQTPFGENK